MKPLLLIPLVLALAACAPEPKVVYRIPPDKQEAAAKLMYDLTRSLSQSGYSPNHTAETAREQVERIYGEPVIIRP